MQTFLQFGHCGKETFPTYKTVFPVLSRLQTPDFRLLIAFSLLSLQLLYWAKVTNTQLSANCFGKRQCYLFIS